MYGFQTDSLIHDGLYTINNTDQNMTHSAAMFAKEKETPDMLAGSAALSADDENLISFGKTHESVENFDPKLPAPSSSDDPVAPAAKKVKVDLPHTPVHKGKSYHLSDYGLKNYNKLLENKQLERGIPAKNVKNARK